MDAPSTFSVSPISAQIDVRDPTERDYPQWATGKESAVSNGRSIAVATRGDAEGRVSIQVGHDKTDVPGEAVLAFDGEIFLATDILIVGNLLAGEEHEIDVGAGTHRIAVYKVPEASASRVFVVLDEARLAPRATR